MLDVASALPEDTALLKVQIAELQAENEKLTATLRAHDLVVQALRLQIAKLKKQAFGKSSEKIRREIEQLELALEDLLVTASQQGFGQSEEEEALKSSCQAGSERPQARCNISDFSCSLFAVGRPDLPEPASKCGNKSGIIFCQEMWDQFVGTRAENSLIGNRT